MNRHICIFFYFKGAVDHRDVTICINKKNFFFFFNKHLSVLHFINGQAFLSSTI